MVADMATLTGARLRQLQALALPYPQALAAFQALSAELQASAGPLSRGFASVLDDVLLREARFATRFELARLAARCLDHRRRKGDLPARLEDLGEPPQPASPGSDKPFVLSRREGKVWIEDSGSPDLRWQLLRD
jgi:hypothetical protein